MPQTAGNAFPVEIAFIEREFSAVDPGTDEGVRPYTGSLASGSLL
jgi:hypothetical protein